MEVDRQILVLAQVPQRVPVFRAEVGDHAAVDLVLVHVRVGIDVDAAQAHRHAAFGFLYRLPDVPPGQQRHREQALAGFFLNFGHRVVVDLHRRQPQFRIDLGRLLTAETQDVGIDDLGVDAGLVHHGETSFHLRGTGVNILEAQRHEGIEVARLAALLEDRAVGMRAGADRLVAVDDPAANPVQVLHLRHAVADRGRRAARPQVPRLGQVSVGIDHLDGRSRLGLFECGGVHRCLPCGSCGSRLVRPVWIVTRAGRRAPCLRSRSCGRGRHGPLPTSSRGRPSRHP